MHIPSGHDDGLNMCIYLLHDGLDLSLEVDDPSGRICNLCATNEPLDGFLGLLKQHKASDSIRHDGFLLPAI